MEGSSKYAGYGGKEGVVLFEKSLYYSNTVSNIQSNSDPKSIEIAEISD